MYLNRIASHPSSVPEANTTTAVAMPTGFMVCPPAVLHGLTPERLAFIQHVYQLAREQVQAARKPRLLELLYHPSAN